MNDTRPPSNDPLHGVTLEALLTELVARHGWEELGRRIEVRCFNYDPSITSSLKFLRKTPWARQKVEELYLRGLGGRGYLDCRGSNHEGLFAHLDQGE